MDRVLGDFGFCFVFLAMPGIVVATWKLFQVSHDPVTVLLVIE